MTGVTFLDFNSAPVPKFFNPGPAILQIWESDTGSDSGYYHWSNRNLPMFLLKKWPHRHLLLPKLKSESGSGSEFSQIFDSGSGSGCERKTQNLAGVDSGTPDPWPTLIYIFMRDRVAALENIFKIFAVEIKNKCIIFWKAQSTACKGSKSCMRLASRRLTTPALCYRLMVNSMKTNSCTANYCKPNIGMFFQVDCCSWFN